MAARRRLTLPAPARARAAGAAVAAAAILILSTSPAGAESAAEVRTLAAQAHDDPGALARLRQVDDIDGRSVDLAQVLDGAEGDDLDRRLDAIESAAAGEGELAVPGVGTDGPRQAAGRILSESRFQPPKPPRPLAGAIRQLGRWLEPVVRPLARWLAPVGRLLLAVYRNTLAMAVVGLLVVALAAATTARMVKRRSHGALADGEGAIGGRRQDPDALEREADAAEAAGDLDRAFRLRFLAGVLRLDRAGVLRYRPSLTTGELVRTVRSDTLPGLAAAFDQIAYGGRHPAPDDVARAKQDWPRVLQEARR